ncbi:MAG: hypothetical protein Kow00108_14590 [Calditrichia bacterium]
MYEFIAIVTYAKIILVAGFFLIFVIPGIFPYLRKYDLIDRVIISFLFLNSIIIVFSPILVEARILDFYGILTLVTVIYLLPKIWRARGNMLKVVRDLEQRSVYNLVVIMEHWSDQKFKDKAKNFISQKKSRLWLFVKRPGVLLFLGASLTRLYIVLRFPEPMGRDWYIYLSDLKYIQKGLFWKELFIDRGSAVISSFYSVLTQTTPELFLHIAGAILLHSRLVAVDSHT